MSDIGEMIPKRAFYRRVVRLVLWPIRLVWLTLTPFLRRGNRWTRKAERRQYLAFWRMGDKVRNVWSGF